MLVLDMISSCNKLYLHDNKIALVSQDVNSKDVYFLGQRHMCRASPGDAVFY